MTIFPRWINTNRLDSSWTVVTLEDAASEDHLAEVKAFFDTGNNIAVSGISEMIQSDNNFIHTTASSFRSLMACTCRRSHGSKSLASAKRTSFITWSLRWFASRMSAKRISGIRCGSTRRVTRTRTGRRCSGVESLLRTRMSSVRRRKRLWLSSMRLRIRRSMQWLPVACAVPFSRASTDQGAGVLFHATRREWV